MNQSLPVYVGSGAATRTASSPAGEPRRPVAQNTGRTTTRVTSFAWLFGMRTVISASPGTTWGGLTMTVTSYAPALPT